MSVSGLWLNHVVIIDYHHDTSILVYIMVFAYLEDIVVHSTPSWKTSTVEQTRPTTVIQHLQ